MRICFLFIFLLTSALSFSQAPEKPKALIFDSDMGPDYDDVGAITMLHAFADSGYINILATISSTNYDGVAGVFNVFNTYFNRPSLPIGVPKNNALALRDWQHWTDTILLKYPHSVQSNDEACDAVQLYRELLARQPDRSVTVVTVGFLTNLANLLRSGPDNYSPLDGLQLVGQKVKELVCMAGRFPSGTEFNVEKDAAASAYVFEHWPTGILLSGFEIGQKIKTGLPLIADNQISNSPVKEVFSICIPKSKEDSAGRMSWDETAILIAVKGYEPFYTVQKGKMKVDMKGNNSWSDEGNLHAYLKEKVSPAIVNKYIDRLLMHQPYMKTPRRRR